jgi:hypothetical protein
MYMYSYAYGMLIMVHALPSSLATAAASRHILWLYLYCIAGGVVAGGSAEITFGPTHLPHCVLFSLLSPNLSHKLSS